MAVRIITDSGSDILPGTMEGLTVLPLTIAFGNDVYHDGVDLSHEHFFELLSTSDEFPTTGQVPPFRFSQAFEQVMGEGDEAVVVTISSGVSGTWQSACSAAADWGGRVHVVDSRHVSVGERLLVEVALKMAGEGASAPQIVDELERRKRAVRFVALLNTLEYLRRGGRISNVSAALGTILAIKPVVGVDEGKVVVMDKPRGIRNARKIVARLVRDDGIDFGQPRCIGYTGDSPKPVQEFLDAYPELWQGKGELPVCSVGGTIGTHAGPGGFLLAYFAPEA